MLTTSCPSCGSPLTFQSGAALTAICPACRSCVVREGDVVRDYGKIARFQRDLSPIQLDAHGKLGTRTFRVVGVLRKARRRVRWNEWYVLFDDGSDGWIGEGNGQWAVYAEAVEVPRDTARATGAGGVIEAGGATFRVTEAASAAIVAAEGQLPFAIHPGEPTRYMDLREKGGHRVGTLDFADDPPTLWIGEDVTLLQLQMEGLRPFAGWSDPALLHFAGPEVTEVRSLGCEGCGASNMVRAPGQSLRLACAYCGSVLAIDALDGYVRAELLERRAEAGFSPRLPPGTRGKLKGVDWAVIGAMVRFVEVDGRKWPWTEYLLHNPYRGFAWLVEDTQRHWSFVEPLRGELPEGDDRLRRWRGRAFAHFQSGTAEVRHVLGEFTWEVAAGDRAFTADFVDPPQMLSFERTDEEITWSVGTWLPHTEVAKAFGVEVRKPSGVAPHQPNPHKDPKRIRSVVVRGLALLVVALVLLVLAVFVPTSRPLVAHEYTVTAGENAWVTNPIELADPEVVKLRLSSTVPSKPDVTLSLINTRTGQVWDWTAYGSDSARVLLSAGAWHGRVALPVAVADADAGASVRLRADTDPGWALPSVLLVLFSLLAPVAYFVDLAGFEHRRFEDSDWAFPLFDIHNVLGWLGAPLVLAILWSGFAPVTGPLRTVPESVRANPASYRPVYVPTSRGGGSGGGWSGGK